VNALIKARIGESIKVKEQMLADEALFIQLETLAADCLTALLSGGKIIFAGNGGSFADAQHLSAEFTSRFLFDRAPLPSLALGTNSSAMSAVGNDYGYDQVFSRELHGIAQPQDVFIGISTSGNSLNIVKAVEAAVESGIRTVVLTGQSGGVLAALCECFRVPSSDTPRIQECHILLGHILCELVEQKYFEKIKSCQKGEINV
jgi:D-sedoheptulose 7-phosphate isomerase